MKMRQLGQDGPRVHPVGIGAMSFSDFYGPTNEDESIAILDAAIEAGVNHIDTSNVYGMGRSEAVIGNYLKANPAAREHFVIATKGGIRRNPDGPGSFFDNSADHLRTALEESLRRLGVEAVDLFYVHRREAARPIEDVTDTLAGLVREGKAKAIGFSEIAPTSLRRAQALHPVAAVQSEYSLSTRSPEMGLVETCADLGTALVAFSPVGRSLLTDTPLSFGAVQELPFLVKNPRFMQPNYGYNIAAVAPFRQLAAELDMSAAGLAIAWVLSRGTHILPIPGTRSLGHFRELLEGASRELGAGDLARIDAILPIGWAHGDRYSVEQWKGPENYC